MFGLIGFFLVFGCLFLLAKVALGLVLLPIKIGIGLAKALLVLLLGIPLVILGCVALGVVLPIVLFALPFVIIGALIFLPCVVLFKALS